MVEALVRKAVLTGCPSAIQGDVAEYLSDTAASILEDEGRDPEAFREALRGSFLPFLEDYGVAATDSAAFCEVVHRAAFPAAAISTKPSATSAKSADADLLCRLPDLLMMYGGSTAPMLKNTTLEFVKGHLYGVVGANGTGKSTLMSRIATKDIVGFPKTVRVVHLSPDKLLEGIQESTCVQEYARRLLENHDAAQDEAITQALSSVGFDSEMLGKPVIALSGGWQMRLALACALAQKANLLLLDEPTNHLDTAGVQWLVDFLAGICTTGVAGATAMVISHDPGFLDQVCTDIIHFTSDSRLAYHKGNFTTFKMDVLNGDQAEADRLLEIVTAAPLGASGSERMTFPSPEKIGATPAARKAPVLTLQGLNFQYEEGQQAILTDVNVKLSMESRVAIVGANGAGKSTLLALLADRMKPTHGEIWRHKSMRLAYVAQSHLTHLGESLTSTPFEYMQARFRCGYDSTVPEKEAGTLTASQESDRKRLGIQFGKQSKPVQAVLSRKEQVQHGGTAGQKEYLYDVQWEGLGDAGRTWEGRGKLGKCGAIPLVDDLDARLWYAWAGVDQRSTSEKEIIKHMAPFGLSEEIVCHRKISMLSSGQKIKLMFGAALWTRPHVLCLDEPTNYLDVESVEMLQEALISFHGGYAVVTHHQDFAHAISNETWTVADGQVSGAKRIWGKAKAKARSNN